MATAEEVQVQIAAAQRSLDAARERGQQVQKEIVDATERQRLRRILDGIEARVFSLKSHNEFCNLHRQSIDADELGLHLSEVVPGSGSVHSKIEPCRRGPCQQGNVDDWSKSVVKTEYVWKLKGMSWLTHGLDQIGEDTALSDTFKAGQEVFRIVYMPRPDQGVIGTGVKHGAAEHQIGSLALCHLRNNGITLRYKFFIKRAGGDFVQWGDTTDECHPDWEEENKAFGPDVQVRLGDDAFDYPIGVFGLKHEDLLNSEWVGQDTLTVKVSVEVRRPTDSDASAIESIADIPDATLGANFLALLQDGKCSDVTFMVDGQQIKAHSQILCARSEVFDRELNCGLKESVSWEVVIVDCDAVAFKGFLGFLYTDDFCHIEELVKANTGGGASSSTDCDLNDTRISNIQNLLTLSHTYQVRRLQLWCQQQLGKCICLQHVCSVLRQAHLYEAKNLEKACLSFIAENMEALVATPSFGRFTEEWPEVVLKIAMFTAGLPESKAAAVLEAHQLSRKKRQARRDEDDTPLQIANEDSQAGALKRKRSD